MMPEQSIDIQLVDGRGRPATVKDVLAEIHLFMSGDYRYGFKVGRTNDAGQLTISGKEIEKLRRDCAKENLMDYNTPLEECDPVVKILIPSEKELRTQCENVKRLHDRPPEWAIRWPANGRVTASEKMVEVTGPEIRANIVVDPIGTR